MKTIQNLRKQILACLLAAVMVLTMLPITAQAAEIQAGTPTITPNIGRSNGTVIGFAGQEWWVIGNAATGVYPQANAATLLAKSSGNPYGSTAFRSSGTSYASSTLANYLNGGNVLGTFPAKEQGLINARNAFDGINGDSPTNQMLWALSESEWNAIADVTVRSYGANWWLRGTSSNGSNVWVSYSNGNILYSQPPSYTHAARPAFSLNLSSVLFTSAASGDDVKPASVGHWLTTASTPTGTVKFTVQDNALTLGSVTQTAASGNIISFDYTGATEGKTLSAIVTNNAGKVKYYGKLVASTAASGSADITIPVGLAATDIVKIFVEEANGDNYTDFASAPVTLDYEVAYEPGFRVGGTDYATLEEAVSVVSSGGTIAMLKNVVLAEDEWIELNADKTYTIDFGGYTLDGSAGSGGLLRILKGNVTLQNGGVSDSGPEGGIAICVSGGIVNIISGTYSGGDTAILADNGTVTITSGRFYCRIGSDYGCLSTNTGDILLAPDSVASETSFVNNLGVTYVNVTVRDVPYLDVAGTTQYKDGDTVTVLSSAADIIGNTLTTGWYLLRGSFTLSSMLTISGDVHLILEDGCDFTVTTSGNSAGIAVYGTGSLTIYAQSTGSDMGKLTAIANGSGGAGIGGWYPGGDEAAESRHAGAITIHGGNITAKGSSSAAGIGGGFPGGSGGVITITGGEVYAYGSPILPSTGGGAGIGGGGSNSDPLTFPAIPGGDSGFITISGDATIYAYGGRGYYGGAGIGSGSCMNGEPGGIDRIVLKNLNYTAVGGIGTSGILGAPIGLGGSENGNGTPVVPFALFLTAGDVSRTSDAAATVKFTSDEAGQYYYEVVDSGAAAPSINTSGAGVACDTTEQTITLSALTAGAKDIYIVVKDAAGNVSADTFMLAVPAYVLAPEPTPAAAIDYVNEILTGLVPGTYSFNGDANVDVTGTTYAIGTSWMTFSMLSIVKKGDGTATSDSAAQSLLIPARPPAPTSIQGVNETIAGRHDGRITGVSSSLEYRGGLFSAWTPCNGPYIEGLEPATYELRKKAETSVLTAAFASEVVTVVVTAGAPEATYAVTVTNGTANPVTAAAGATVTITANAATAGQQFKNWTTSSSGVTFASANSASTTFIMPANEVTIMANYENTSHDHAVIQAAEDAKVGVVTSVDGRDVSYDDYWVSAVDLDVFDQAIAAAEAVLDNPASTASQVAQAEADLEVAIEVFNAAKRSGTKNEDFTSFDAAEVPSSIATRYDTMADIVIGGKVFTKENTSTVILANGDNFPDALAASGFAGLHNAPIVLTAAKQNTLSRQALDVLTQLEPTTVYIMGSADSITAAAATQVSKLPYVNSVKRLGGTNRYATALRIYEEGKLASTKWNNTAIVANADGDNAFADALSISPYAYAEGAPIFLSSKDNGGLSKDAQAALKAGGFTRVLLLGSTNSVPKLVETQLTALGLDSSKQIRLAGNLGNNYGDNRYGTSSAIVHFAVADSAKLNYNHLVCAAGEKYADALAGGAYAGSIGTAMLLVSDNSASVDNVIKAKKDQIFHVNILGNNKAVSDSLRAKIKAAYSS